MSARDQTQPVLAALGDELRQATDAGRGVRISQQFAQELADTVGGLLDQLDEAERPRDERLREQRLLLQATARELLGPGDRDLFTLPDAAKSIRDAAGVGRDADINTLLAEVSAAAAIYARPEYGPKSRWQALRDQIEDLERRLDLSQKSLVDTADQRESLRIVLADALEKNAAHADAVRSATWLTEPTGWLITDQARNDILDA